ncbi:carbohydrate ABC transporter permease [Facklamia lactis]|nr:sugar ABC transporter permease [Facklamia lactis]
MSKKRREALWGYFFVSPFILGLIVFWLGPILFSLFGSFTDYNLTSKMNYIGFDNFKRMFNEDDLFWKALKNTFYFTLFNVPLTTLFSCVLALMLNCRIPGIRIYRTIFYLPAVLTGVAVYVLWMQLLSPNHGLVNLVLSWFGISGPAWLSDPNWTKPALILMKLWSAGGSMLLYLATLQSIPKTLYEAAEMDQATSWHKFRYITLPLITPIIFFDITTSTIGSFQIFQEAYVMTENSRGGPANSLLFYNFHMWNKAFVAFDMGYAMALSLFLFFIILIITIINLKVAPYWVFYAGGDKK